MSRFCGERDSGPLNEAATVWMKRALFSNGSVFSDAELWTETNVMALEEYFSNNLDTGEGNFFEKLEAQLEPCEPEVKQLAAEMLWLLLLCASNIGAVKKRASIERVWSWSGSELPASDLLSDHTLAGVGSAGTSFNTNRWRELAYFIELAKRALKLPLAERESIFSDFVALGRWLSNIPENDKRQFRHMLLYMLHPDQAERIFSRGDRIRIALKFTGKPKRSLVNLTAAEMDQLLLNIRSDQEEEFGTKDLCFYLSPMKELWKDSDSRSWLFVWNPGNWDWEELNAQIQKTRQGENVVLRWRCVNQDAAPGDRAWLIRLGQEPKGIMASGNVVSEPYEAEHYDADRADAGETCQYVDIEFSEIRDVFKDPIIEMADLNTITIDKQQWTPQSSGIEIKKRSAALVDKLWQRKPVKPSTDAVAEPKSEYAGAPVNRILYGPPGTGKTFQMNRLKQRYVVKQVNISHEQWLSEQLKSTNWFDVVFMTLYDLEEKARVKDIEQHPFFVQKAKAVGRTSNLKAQIWSTLQTHTIESSTTVNYTNRQTPLVFDKDSESAWRLAGNWQEDGEDLVQRAKSLKAGTPSKADQVHYAFVTFHQAYSYEDFVEGIRPVQDSETQELTYRVEPGIFRQICQDAKNAPNTKFALFIDEINRGNIAKIFGELITLIEVDKRAIYDASGNLTGGMELTLPYSRELFGVPKNLDIYGTMNTADRSIALLDTALRRRFTFEELMPNPKVISGSRGDGYIEDGEGGLIDLRTLLSTMNQRIRFLLNRDLTLGHAYLFNTKDFSQLKEVFLNQFIPLLQEYFYNDWHRIQLVLGDVGMDKQPIEPQIIQHQVLNSTQILGFEYEDLDELIDYRVAAPADITPDSIRKIYESQE